MRRRLLGPVAAALTEHTHPRFALGPLHLKDLTRAPVLEGGQRLGARGPLGQSLRAAADLPSEGGIRPAACVPTVSTGLRSGG
ncbi:hypothetical protein GCM10018952_02100 [Streptosporangium vulgare]